MVPQQHLPPELPSCSPNTHTAGRSAAETRGGSHHLPGTVVPVLSPERQSYCIKIFATVGIATGLLKVLFLMIHPAKERILKADNYHGLSSETSNSCFPYCCFLLLLKSLLALSVAKAEKVGVYLLLMVHLLKTGGSGPHTPGTC